MNDQSGGYGAARFQHRKVIAECQALAKKTWVEKVVKEWPGPVAHEYARLRTELQNGQLVAAWLQLRDTYEVLIKLPAAVLISAHQGPLPEDVVKNLLQKPASLGDWLSAANLLAHQTPTQDPEPIRNVRELFFRNNRATNLAKLLQNAVQWRNESIGHGALTLHPNDLLNDLKEKLPELHQALAQAADSWQGTEMIAGEIILKGAESIATNHEHGLWPDPPKDPVPIRLRWEGAELSLAPWLTARCCSQCGKAKAFLFNSSKRGERFFFLDYLRGHSVESPGRKEPLLSALAKTQPPTEAPPDGYTFRGPAISATLAASLEQMSLEADVIPPDYLLNWIDQTSKDNDRAACHLIAPAHFGKSIFCAELKKTSGKRGKPFVAVFTVKREFQSGPNQFAAFIDNSLKSLFDVAESSDGPPIPKLSKNLEDRAQGHLPLPELVALYRKLYQASHANAPPPAVIICIDGLDELPNPKAGEQSIADLLPAPSELPESLYLLVASRPQTETDPQIWNPFASRVSQQTGAHVRNIGSQDPGYLALLERYFWERLNNRFRNEAEAGSETQSELKQRYQTLFHEVLTHTGSVFLYFSYVVGMLQDGTVNFGEIDLLPKPGLLFSHYIDQLTVVGPNRFDFMHRILLTLAALEDAHERELALQEQETPGLVEDPWRGLPLDWIAELISEPENSARLVFAVYSLKEVLRSHKEDAGHESRYRLGLKGLAQTLREDQTNDYRRIQASLASRAFAAAAENPALWTDLDRYLILRAWAFADSSQAALSQQAREFAHWTWSEAYRLQQASEPRGAIRRLNIVKTLLRDDPNEEASILMARGVAYDSQNRLEEAVGDYGSAISIRDGIRAVLEPRGEWSPSYRNDLAAAYMNRGVAYDSQNRLEEAVGDYGSAISIMDGIRAVLEPRGEWSPSYRNDLAAAYMNRANAFQGQNRLEEAVGDYGSAISIMDGIRAVLEPRGEWSPSYRNDLAAAYMNRANAFQGQNRLEEAVGDYGSAISIMDGIRAVLEPRGEWSPSYRNDLAAAYMNRANAFQGQNRLEEAVGDYGSAISIRDGIRAVLEPRGEWSPSYRNDLAGAYMNRANAFQGQNRLEEAVGDYGSAISIMDGIRAVLEARGEWSPSYRNSLAAAYMNRGVAYRSQNRLEEAVGDYGSAISIRDGIRAVLEPRGEWSPSYRNDLAGAYMNRANAFQGQNRLEEAVGDYGSAISIRDGIRAVLEPRGEWSPSYRNDLAAAYMNRGVAYRSQNRLEEAVGAYGSAISIRDGIRAVLEPRGEWSPSYRNDLAAAYVNRANAFQGQNRLEEAVGDYGSAISIRDGIRAVLEPRGEWSPSYRNDLASTYFNRGLLFEHWKRPVEAANDYLRSINIVDPMLEGAPLLVGRVFVMARSRFAVLTWKPSDTRTITMLRRLLDGLALLIQTCEDKDIPPDMFIGAAQPLVQRLRKLNPVDQRSLLASLGGRHAAFLAQFMGWSP